MQSVRRIIGLTCIEFVWICSQACVAQVLVPNSAAPEVGGDFPDIRSVATDLEMPVMVDGRPMAGERTRRRLSGAFSEKIYHSLYLPDDWKADERWPILVEYSGNGGYRNQFGDECSGRPEDSCFGFGISAGKDFIWICLPYLNARGDDLAITWWGDPPTFDPSPTLKYLQAAIDDACANFGGDCSRVILCGFSRGAIACNFLGLHDDAIAERWKAFIPFSHYDGVRSWPFPESDGVPAATRLARLKRRPQFICGESDQVLETRDYLKQLAPHAKLTFSRTGFRNHSDRWVLRPSLAREQLREWLQAVVQ